MGKFAIVLDVFDNGKKAVLWLLAPRDSKYSRCTTFILPESLVGAIFPGDSLKELEDSSVVPCSPVRHCQTVKDSTGKTYLKIKTLLKVNFKTTAQSNDDLVYSEEFGKILVSNYVANKIRNLSATYILTEIASESSTLRFSKKHEGIWKIVENAPILKVAEFQEDPEPPYQILPNSIVFGPLEGVIVQRTPGAYLLWNENMIAILKSEASFKIGLWCEFYAVECEEMNDFPVDCTHIVTSHEISAMPCVPTIVRAGRESVSLEVTGVYKYDGDEKCYCIFTQRFGRIYLGLQSAIGSQTLKPDETICVILSLTKDDTRLTLAVDRFEKMDPPRNGIVVKNSTGSLAISIGNNQYIIPKHVSQHENVELGYIVSANCCSSPTTEKRVCSYRIIRKGLIGVYCNNEDMLEGEFNLSYKSSLKIKNETFNVFKDSFGLEFIDFDRVLPLVKSVDVSAIWNPTLPEPRWILKALLTPMGSHIDKCVTDLAEIQISAVNPPTSNRRRTVLQTNSFGHIRKNMTVRSCKCDYFWTKLLSSPSPNPIIEKESADRINLLVLDIHEHSETDLTVARFFVSDTSFGSKTIIQVIFGPGFENKPDNLVVGRWFEQIIQRIRISDRSKPFRLRTKYGEVWDVPNLYPQEPGTTRCVERDSFKILNCKMQLRRVNDCNQYVGEHVVLSNDQFGYVLAFYEDNVGTISDPLDEAVEEVIYEGFVEPLRKPLKIGKTFLWCVSGDLVAVRTVMKETMTNENYSRTSTWEANDFLSSSQRLVDCEIWTSKSRIDERKKKQERSLKKYKTSRVSKANRILNLQRSIDLLESYSEMITPFISSFEKELAVTKESLNDKIQKRSQRITIGARFIYSVLSDESAKIALECNQQAAFEIILSTLQEQKTYLEEIPGLDLSLFQNL